MGIFRRFAMTPSSLSSVLKAKTSTTTLLISFLVIFSFVLAACGGGATTTQKTTVLTVSNGPVGSFPQNFNPLVASNGNPGPRGMIYETLLYFNWQQGTINPWLAASYQWSTDASSVTFHLRPNVQWSDGQAFSSDDVVFTLNML